MSCNVSSSFSSIAFPPSISEITLLFGPNTSSAMSSILKKTHAGINIFSFYGVATTGYLFYFFATDEHSYLYFSVHSYLYSFKVHSSCCQLLAVSHFSSVSVFTQMFSLLYMSPCFSSLLLNWQLHYLTVHGLLIF